MNLTATEMDELAWICHDFRKGIHAQLEAEQDAADERRTAATLGRLWRASRGIAVAVTSWLLVALMYAAVMASMHGCSHASDAERRFEALRAHESSQTADIAEEKQGSFSDTEVDKVRAREPDPRLATVGREVPRTCILKATASWCWPCRHESITSRVQRSKWIVESVDIDDNPEFAKAFDIAKIPFWIIVVHGEVKGTFVGSDYSRFLSVLKEACK